MTVNEMSAIAVPPATILVVAGALVREGRWLMQRRPVGKAHGGLWEFPGGKVDPGETPVAALVRELGEELDIAVAPADCAPLSFATHDRIVMLLYVVARWQGEPRPLAASALRWAEAEALARLPMPPVDIPLVAALPPRARG
ncbi:hypothetical protein ASG29_10960 [Sphingomonas sp. Leaf412]|uniref:(deoxy)nucleoside triphosphate pyrophosphohydrolase n=1 Tax=Sphingomonas sp. Leaf412 TaxID=1736370 RepID=UPI0006F4BC11|nr:(deoxy)nucleoside triphosphate pyrophosphohydrolase [Sphingomonas sp. Leaf412]KQT32321.1 hypothetical protein ASG29_10960 [Sphingomonas sp. Leaf412]